MAPRVAHRKPDLCAVCRAPGGVRRSAVARHRRALLALLVYCAVWTGGFAYWLHEAVRWGWVFR